MNNKIKVNNKSIGVDTAEYIKKLIAAIYNCISQYT